MGNERLHVIIIIIVIGRRPEMHQQHQLPLLVGGDAIQIKVQ